LGLLRLGYAGYQVSQGIWTAEQERDLQVHVDANAALREQRRLEQIRQEEERERKRLAAIEAARLRKQAEERKFRQDLCRAMRSARRQVLYGSSLLVPQTIHRLPVDAESKSTERKEAQPVPQTPHRNIQRVLEKQLDRTSAGRKKLKAAQLRNVFRQAAIMAFAHADRLATLQIQPTPPKRRPVLRGSRSTTNIVDRANSPLIRTRSGELAVRPVKVPQRASLPNSEAMAALLHVRIPSDRFGQIASTTAVLDLRRVSAPSQPSAAALERKYDDAEPLNIPDAPRVPVPTLQHPYTPAAASPSRPVAVDVSQQPRRNSLRPPTMRRLRETTPQ
jgi:hypothetical protein